MDGPEIRRKPDAVHGGRLSPNAVDAPDVKSSSAVDVPGGEASVNGSLPSISLPKGGGAIRGLGEKFSVNAANGSASVSIPVPAGTGRGGFAPHLNLAYDSAGGNGAFGFGWALDTPATTRKTDRGLPRYLDAEEFDVFILSGAEDLVPVLDAQGARQSLPRTVFGIDYLIHFY